MRFHTRGPPTLSIVVVFVVSQPVRDIANWNGSRRRRAGGHRPATISMHPSCPPLSGPAAASRCHVMATPTVTPCCPTFPERRPTCWAAFISRIAAARELPPCALDCRRARRAASRCSVQSTRVHDSFFQAGAQTRGPRSEADGECYEISEHVRYISARPPLLFTSYRQVRAHMPLHAT